MGKWILFGLVMVVGIKSIAPAVPLMAISGLTSAAKDLIGTITEDIAPGHNKIKDPFALSNDTKKIIQKINKYMDDHPKYINETRIILKDTEKELANVNQRLFEIDKIAKEALNATEYTTLNLNKVLIKSSYVVSELPKITAKIDKKLVEMINNLAKRIEVDMNFRIASKLLSEKITHIQNMYREYVTNLDPKRDLTTMTHEMLFNATLTDGAGGIIDDLSQIEALMTAATGDKAVLYKGFLNYFTKKGQLMTYVEKCGLGDTYQNRLKGIYNLISINEYRALMMLVIAHKYFEVQNDRSAKDNIMVLYEQYINRTIHHLTAMKTAMALASTEIVECDPPQYLLDINAFSFTNLFSMIYISTDQIGDRCTQSCPKINTLNKLSCKVELTKLDVRTVTEYCPKHQCNGRIHECTVRNDKYFCEARQGEIVKYHWIEDSAPEAKQMQCNGRWVDVMKDSKCIQCMCTCSAEGAESTATRAVSFLPQFSNVSDNRVVSNVRFRKKDNVVHIQIEDAILLPGGEIDLSSRRWVPLDDLVYLRNTPEGGLAKRQGQALEGMVFNVNYTFLSKDKKSLYLDDVLVDKNYVVTGAMFRNAHENSEKGTPNLSAIQLQIFKTKYDYQKGILSTKEENQHIPVVANNVTQSHNNEYGRSRSKRKLGNLRPSMDSQRNEDVSKANMELDFIMTGKKNLGKAVIPFFDGRPASQESQVPLSGIGIIHRKRDGYGGFISPKLIGMDHSVYVDAQLSDSERQRVIRLLKKLLEGKKKKNSPQNAEEISDEYEDYESPKNTLDEDDIDD